MSPALLDVDLLVALAWPSHVHHRRALSWFGSGPPDGFATCPVTQSGFVRVSSNRRVFPDAVRPGAALDLLREIVSLDGHSFWDDATDFSASPFLATDRIHGHAQVTDAHLLAIALAHGGRLATFDRSLRELVPRTASPDRVVEIVG